MKKQFCMSLSVLFAVFGLSVIVPTTSLANNLMITNVSLEDRDITANTVIVEFDISWENSWRDEINYDAAWIVLKVSRNGGATLSHGEMEACGIDPEGTSPGTNEDVVIDVPCNDADQSGTAIYPGAFIYRSSTGSGSFGSSNVRLVLDYNRGNTAAADTDTLAVTVIGIEMVYIPEGPFQAGDGAGTGAFWQRNEPGGKHPWYISSENAIVTTDGTSGSFYFNSTGSETSAFASGAIFTIYAEYPKGFHEFYCMKYELTEGQWITFFNNAGAPSGLDITGASGKNQDTVDRRNTISWPGSGDATSERPDRAISFISWMDLSAYLDWVALRPMSELEFEKVARGEVSAVPHEYAWGTSTITPGETFSHSPEDGTETFTTANANAVYDRPTFSQGDDFLPDSGDGRNYVLGPARVGIFATDSSTRESSGAGFYGVMELSGNLRERVVSVGNTSGTIYFPFNGDGVIAGSVARQLGWIGTSATEGGQDGVDGATGSGTKGGSWAQRTTTTPRLEISDRSEATTTRTNRSNQLGGRGVRSVAQPSYPTCGNSVQEPPEQCDGVDALGSCTICDDTTCTCNNGGGS